MRSLILFACAVVVVWPGRSHAQSNYASQANSIEYQGEGLPEEATLDGKVTKLDDLSPIIFLNRTKAALNCAAGFMQVELKFNEPFYGKAYADYDRNSACQTSGKGDLSYRIDLPLKGCGTKQGPQRVFTNNIVVRFHPGLEMDGDEIITIVCRYPPPVAPIPAGLPAPIINEPAIVEPPLKGIQILFIICAIMFLTLLLLGLGVSYYCLRRRPIPIVRRVVHVGSGSEITALESGSIGSVSGFKVARPVVAVPPPIQSSSGSEGALIPSDYPSESQSENEEVETGSLPVSSRGSSSAYENGAYVHDGISIASADHHAYGQTHELHLAGAALPPSPKFDIQVRVKRSPPPPPSLPSMSGSSMSDTESNSSTLISHGGDRNNLSTILETQEDRDSVMTTESIAADGAQSHFTYVPELHSVPAHLDYPPSPPPIPRYNTTVNIQSKQPKHPHPRSPLPVTTTSTNRRWLEVPDGPRAHDTHSLTELVDASHLYQLTGTHVTSHTNRAEDAVQQLPEPPIAVYKKPELKSHVVDDLFLTTVTERTTIEDVERHKRLVTEYKARPVPAPAPPPPPPVDPTWDVTIRNYEAQRQRQWEDFSDVSSASGAPSVASASMPVPSSTYLPSAYAADELRSPELVGNMKPVELPPEDRSVSNWDVLIRVLQERIRSDARYENLFEPRSWDVIIRILAPPEDVELRQSKRSKKRETWDTRSRRSSLPTLYEYDSDGDSSVRTITQEPQLVASTHLGYAGHAGSLASGSRSRRTSRSSYNSNNIDMRSMSEVIVDFGRMSGGPSGRTGSGGEPSEEGSSYIVSHSKAYFDDDDDDEEARYDQRSLQRSLSHPSLARSASEFTERWIIPEDHMDLRPDSEANNSSMYGSGTMDVDTRTTYIKQSRTTVSRERRDNW
uniref:ZP domain-containing protein n=1 Tax=Anopheles epiroticus TaxID=199890 RepID=A0A182PH01_9DIPT